MVITLAILLGVTMLFLASAIIHITKIQKELVHIDREQHTQNAEMLKLLKGHMTHQEMLLQHIEILKYLVEQDPKLNKGNKMYFTGPVGEA